MNRCCSGVGVSTSSIVSNRHAHSCGPRVDACCHLTMARRHLTALFRARCRVKAQHDKASPHTPEIRRRRMQRRSLSSWDLCRLGILMEPDLADPREAEGVLNPAVARGPDGHLYLLPRLVAARNYSRIGLARVRFNQGG